MFKKYPKNYLDKDNLATTEFDYSSALPLPQHFATNPKTPAATIAENTVEFEGSEEPETTISENVSMRGSLTFQNVLRIDGNFEGEILSQGKIIIGPKGVVKAHIDLEEAFISGKVEGNIRVKKRLVLRGRAEIKGDIVAESLSVDEGVHINGHVKVGYSPESNPLANDLENPLLF